MDHNTYNSLYVEETKTGLNDFLSLCKHLIVPFLFHDMTSLNLPSFQRNDFSARFGGKAPRTMMVFLHTEY